MTNREGTDIVSETLKARESVQLSLHAVAVYDACENADEHKHILEAFTASRRPVDHDIGLYLLKRSLRLCESTFRVSMNPGLGHAALETTIARNGTSRAELGVGESDVRLNLETLK